MLYKEYKELGKAIAKAERELDKLVHSCDHNKGRFVLPLSYPNGAVCKLCRRVLGMYCEAKNNTTRVCQPKIYNGVCQFCGKTPAQRIEDGKVRNTQLFDNRLDEERK